MATEKQRAAARRNIKKAQAAAAAKRATARPRKVPKTAPSAGGDVAVVPEAPSLAPQSDLGSVADLIQRLAAERRAAFGPDAQPAAAAKPSMAQPKETRAKPSSSDGVAAAGNVLDKAKQSALGTVEEIRRLVTDKKRAKVGPTINDAQAAGAKPAMAHPMETSTESSSGHVVGAARYVLDLAKQSAWGIVAVLALLGAAAVVAIVLGGSDRTVPAGGGLPPTATSRSPTQNLNTTEPTPGRPAVGPVSPVPTITPEPRDRVALGTETLVAESWRDIAGTVRVHVVVSATNDTGDVLSLTTGERTFRIVSAAGQTLHTGPLAYAFPLVLAPGATSHLITTVVLPLGADPTDLRVEADIFGEVTTVVQPMLEVSDLRLVSSDGRSGVSGIVRNTSRDDVTFGVVAVIGRDASGQVIGGFYDNVHVASIVAGGQQTFQTEYPGLPPAAAGRIAELSAIAFDVETGLPSPTGSLSSATFTPSPTVPQATSEAVMQEHAVGGITGLFGDFSEPTMRAQSFQHGSASTCARIAIHPAQARTPTVLPARSVSTASPTSDVELRGSPLATLPGGLVVELSGCLQISDDRARHQRAGG